MLARRSLLPAVCVAALSGCMCNSYPTQVPTVLTGRAGDTQVSWGEASTHGDFAVNHSGQIYAVSGNAIVREVNGAMEVVAGKIEPDAGVGATGLARDPQGRLLVLDGKDGSISEIGADNLLHLRLTRTLNAPTGLVVAPDGAIYITSAGDHALQRLAADGIPTLVAPIEEPLAVAREPQGTFVVVDGNRVVRVSPGGAVVPIAGDIEGGYVDGPGAAARFVVPSAVAVDAAGAIYLAEGTAARIRRIAPDGTVSTIQREPPWNAPTCVAVEPDGALVVSDKQGLTLVAPDGKVRWTALAEPGRLTVEPDGRIWVLSSETAWFATLSTVGAPGVTTSPLVTQTRLTSPTLYADGLAAEARFNGPDGLAFDRAGNLYIADTHNQQIRKLSPDGQVSTVAVVGLAHQLVSPTDVALDAEGNLLITDPGAGRIVRLTTAGHASTFTELVKHPMRLAGPAGGVWYVLDELIPGTKDVAVIAALSEQGASLPYDADPIVFASDLAVDARGKLYVADTNELNGYNAGIRVRQIEGKRSSSLIDARIPAHAPSDIYRLQCRSPQGPEFNNFRLAMGDDGTLYIGMGDRIQALTGL